MMNYDLIVIGAGWAGFNAALKAKQFGLKTAIIDMHEVGGTCLNKGCIPTKTLLQSARAYSYCCKSAVFGVENKDTRLNFLRMQQRKKKIVSQLKSGMELMLKDVDFINGHATIVSPNTVKVGAKKLTSRFILVATGAKPVELSTFKFDGNKIMSSDDLLETKDVPGSLLIIGGGVIGCEFASLFSALGSKVEIVEKMPQLLPGEDHEISRRLHNAFKKKGVKINLSTDASRCDLSKYNKVLVCVGRKPATENLGLGFVGVLCDGKAVVIDACCRTNIESIYAAGDCTAKYMLAHYAAYQGFVAAENISLPQNAKKTDNHVVPACVFTDPEIASVGVGEALAKENGIDITVNMFDFRGLAFAHIIDEPDGLIKIISEAENGHILGASIVGAKATEMISLFSLAVHARLKISQLKDAIFAHPTMSECIAEAVHREHAF